LNNLKATSNLQLQKFFVVLFIPLLKKDLQSVFCKSYTALNNISESNCQQVCLQQSALETCYENYNVPDEYRSTKQSHLTCLASPNMLEMLIQSKQYV